MRAYKLRQTIPAWIVLLSFVSVGLAQAPKRAAGAAVSETNVRAEMSFLAGDAMRRNRGRRRA